MAQSETKAASMARSGLSPSRVGESRQDGADAVKPAWRELGTGKLRDPIIRVLCLAALLLLAADLQERRFAEGVGVVLALLLYLGLSSLAERRAAGPGIDGTAPLVRQLKKLSAAVRAVAAAAAGLILLVQIARAVAAGEIHGLAERSGALVAVPLEAGQWHCLILLALVLLILSTPAWLPAAGPGKIGFGRLAVLAVAAAAAGIAIGLLLGAIHPSRGDWLPLPALGAFLRSFLAAAAVVAVAAPAGPLGGALLLPACFPDKMTEAGTSAAWGRSLYANLQKFVVFRLTAALALVGIVLLGSFIGTPLPLTVAQMLWISLILDVFAAPALAAGPPDRDPPKDPPRPAGAFIINRSMRNHILGAGLAFITLFLLAATLKNHLPLDPGTLAGRRQLTLFFTGFVALQFWNLFNAKVFGTTQSAFAHLGASRGFIARLAAIALGQALLVQFGGGMFRLAPLSPGEWLAIALLTSPVLWIGELWRLRQRRSAQPDYWVYSS